MLAETIETRHSPGDKGGESEVVRLRAADDMLTAAKIEIKDNEG